MFLRVGDTRRDFSNTLLYRLWVSPATSQDRITDPARGSLGFGAYIHPVNQTIGSDPRSTRWIIFPSE